MSPQHTEVTAVIPTELLPQFYRWVADAHHQQPIAPEIPPRATATVEHRVEFADASPELIKAWWSKLSDTARDVFTFLAHNADERFTGTDLANELEALTGPSAAAGTFTWPNRHATTMGLKGPWRWDGETYVMPDTDAAVLLAALNPSD